jgi:uncharacterized membrane protein
MIFSQKSVQQDTPGKSPTANSHGNVVDLGFNQRELLLTLLCIVLYAGVTWFTSFMKLQATSDISLRPSVVIPMLFGFAAGPWVGFLGGTLGNSLSDHFLYNSGIADWQWSVGVGIMGLIPGMFSASAHRSYRGWRGQLEAMVVALVSIGLGMGFSAFVAVWLCNPQSTLKSCYVIPTTFGTAFNNAFFPAFKVNSISTLLLLPIMLFNLERQSFRLEDWRSGLFRRLATTIVISAALPTSLLGFFLIQRFSGEQADNTLLFQLVGTVVLSLLFTVANAGILARGFSRPLLELSQAAATMSRGQFSKQQATTLLDNSNHDEIGQLRRTFSQMALDVIAREDSLKQQVAELKIEIDEGKRQKQVSDIVDSDFFRDLRGKAATMRARSQRSEINPNENKSE